MKDVASAYRHLRPDYDGNHPVGFPCGTLVAGVFVTDCDADPSTLSLLAPLDELDASPSYQTTGVAKGSHALPYETPRERVSRPFVGARLSGTT